MAGFAIFAEFLEIAGGDDTGREGDNGYSEEGGEHRDYATDVGGGTEVAVADCGEGHGRPVEGVEEGVEGFGTCAGVDVWFGIEHDEGCYEYIEDSQQKD